MRIQERSLVVIARLIARCCSRSVVVILSLFGMLTLAVSTAPSATAAAPAGIDLVVTSVSHVSAVTGSNVVPSATVKNTGTVATPAGTILDVAFHIEGATVWSDTNKASLAPGASVTLTANGGETGTNYWVATAGSHTLTANVNSVNRITETDKTNNKM